MIGLVGLGLAAVTAIQRPDANGIVVYSLTYIIFSNGIAIWIALSLIKKERLGKLSYTVGDVVIGPVTDIAPATPSAKLKGTLGAMLLVSGFLTVFISGILDTQVLSSLGRGYEVVTYGLTLLFWIPLESVWDGVPVTVDRLLTANYQGAGSLAAATAVLLGELIDAVGVDSPEELFS